VTVGNIKDFDFTQGNSDGDAATIGTIAAGARAAAHGVEHKTERAVAYLLGAIGEVAQDSDKAGLIIKRAGDVLVHVSGLYAGAEPTESQPPVDARRAQTVPIPDGVMTRQLLDNMPPCGCGQPGGCTNRRLVPVCHPDVHFVVSTYVPERGQMLLVCPRCRSADSTVAVQVAGALPS
jgi:hypothetical protein